MESPLITNETKIFHITIICIHAYANSFYLAIHYLNTSIYIPFPYNNTAHSTKHSSIHFRNVELRKLFEIISWFLTSILRIREDFTSRTFQMVFRFIEMLSSMKLVEFCIKSVCWTHIFMSKVGFHFRSTLFIKKFVCFVWYV